MDGTEKFKRKPVASVLEGPWRTLGTISNVLLLLCSPNVEAHFLSSLPGKLGMELARTRARKKAWARKPKVLLVKLTCFTGMRGS